MCKMFLSIMVMFQGCARFPEFVQNFSERQILWSLRSVDVHTFTLQLPIQTLHSVASELQVFVSSLENCQNFSKTSTPQELYKTLCLYINGSINFIITRIIMQSPVNYRSFLKRVFNEIWWPVAKPGFPRWRVEGHQPIILTIFHKNCMWLKKNWTKR